MLSTGYCLVFQLGRGGADVLKSRAGIKVQLLFQLTRDLLVVFSLILSRTKSSGHF